MEWALLGGLSEDERRAVLSTARRRKFDRNEVIFHEADPGAALHLVAKGKVAIRTTTPLGDIATLNVLGAGSHFGELALVSGGYRTASVVALEPAETLALHRDDVEDLRRRHPHIDRLLVDALASHVARLSNQLLEALYIPVEQRVRRRLADMTELYSTNDLDPAITVPLTQDHLAGLAGTSRQTVNKVLRELEEEGVVILGRGRTEVVDRPGLAKRAR